jgi:hypothetical protein
MLAARAGEAMNVIEGTAEPVRMPSFFVSVVAIRDIAEEAARIEIDCSQDVVLP